MQMNQGSEERLGPCIFDLGWLMVFSPAVFAPSETRLEIRFQEMFPNVAAGLHCMW